PKRFESYGWQVIQDVDGHNATEIDSAIQKAQQNLEQPTLIDCKSVIGWGSPNKQGTSGAHGAPLGHDEITLVREEIEWPHEPFHVPDSIYEGWNAEQKGQQSQASWNEIFAAYEDAHPELAKELHRRTQGDLPDNWQGATKQALQKIIDDQQKVATRKASEIALNAVGPLLPELIGGSADLTGSNNTWWSGSKGVSANDASGNYIYYGVREFGMSAIINGMALYGGFIPYSGTFLTFSDYARNAVRMAALMGTHSLFVYTHDSIGLGEDGPTHQSIEHIASLRSIPNLMVWRPCDTVESMVAWTTSIEMKSPAALTFSRQGVPFIERSQEQVENIHKGAYVLFESESTPQLIILATGTEVGISLDAAKQLDEQGIKVRLISMPCADVFDLQDEQYKQSLLPSDIRARIAVEAGITDYWRKYVGLDGNVVGIDQFGASAPGDVLMKHFGFTAENIINRAQALL
ncbi:MAG: transketolase, partial [Pseudomonadota bacterium]